MIIISIIILLVSIALVPFSYYMQRARVEKVSDMIAQEWILAHQAVQNGILSSEKHAYMEINLQKDMTLIPLKLFTGSSIPSQLAPRKSWKILDLETPIQILWFSGSVPSTVTEIRYFITPPFATGSFLDQNGNVYTTGVILTIGYPDATLDSHRARQILLRPYFD